MPAVFPIAQLLPAEGPVTHFPGAPGDVPVTHDA